MGVINNTSCFFQFFFPAIEIFLECSNSWFFLLIFLLYVILSDKQHVGTSDMNYIHGSSKNLGGYYYLNKLLKMLNLTCISAKKDKSSQISEVL